MDTRLRGTFAGAALAALLLAAVLGACAREPQEALGPEDWVNPGLGRAGEPVEIRLDALPYTGTVNEGINYFRIVGLPTFAPQYVAVTGKRADADLFVLGDAGFSDYRCSSTRGGAEDDQCVTAPLASGELFVEVYGFEGGDTGFILDVW